MNEPGSQIGPSWVNGTLLSAFDMEWRKLTSGKRHLGITDSVRLVSDVMRTLLRATKDCVDRSNDPSGSFQHARKEELIFAVQTSVTNTLQSISRPDAAPITGKDKRSYISSYFSKSTAAPQVDVEFLGRTLRNGLSHVEKVLGIVDPPRPQPMSEATRLLRLFQDLLKAKALKNSTMALETIDRLRSYLPSEGIEVVDYDPQNPLDVDEYFDFENEADRSAGGGSMTTPALVQVHPRRVLRPGWVRTTNFDQLDRASGGTSRGREQDR